MLLLEEVLDSSGARDRNHVHGVVSRTGEGMGRPPGYPGEVAGACRAALIVELELQPAGDDEESLVHAVMTVQDWAGSPGGQPKTHRR